MQYVLVALIGYLLGCLNLAWLIAKIKNVNLKEKGSGNPGTSNAVILMGWRIGILVGAHDIGKAVLAVLLAKWLFPDMTAIGEVAGAACVLGHIFPFYLKFKGGKGFASFVGMTFALDWKFGLAIVVVIILVTLIFDYLVVGTTVTVIALPLYRLFTYPGWISAAVIAVATAVIIFVHRKNYVRIAKRTEIGLRSTLKGEHREKTPSKNN